ncbi:heterokaryon incompatibility het-6 [Fusarium mundagurra]|uniref:Heterokaryon incompatibility het-6 n=1 Tax=Fusarium mundagurra TaxID=1567541 RepID=A0A8H5YD18_9HYPO|nr:heterokaryon incompatibility het-6 [Fusarium mundagurra]
MPRFPYPPLLPGEIRLLELQPGTSDDRLTGTILHRKLSPEDAEVPDFEALSYCWGDQSHPEQIKLTTEHPTFEEQSDTPSDFGDIHIGPNLASALRALRYNNLPRIIWCDSICINQKDVTERSGQVQRMHDIYEFASRVVVWLGPATSWSHTAMEMLRWVANMITHLTPEALYNPYGRRLISTADGNETVVDCRESHFLTQDQWLAFEQLLALEWHRRLWTYQEIVLANQETSIVRLGSEEMTWSKFKNAGLFICTCRPLPREFFLDPDSCDINNHAFILKAVRTERPNKRSRDWLTELVFTNPYHCSDNRDRLYALRGLMESDIARCITVDYTKSLKQILSSAFIVHFSEQRNLRFLEYCYSDAYPSWVVNLERPLDPPILTNDACGKSACSATLIESGILEVAGVTCDEIGDDPYILPEEVWRPLNYCIADMVEHLVGNDVHHDDDCLNKLLTVMGYGDFWDYSINRTRFAPDETSMSLEKVREIIRELMADPTSTSLPLRLLSIFRLDLVSGYTKTRNGSFVCVPTGSRRGDVIVTLLGLRSNLVLRPQPKDGSYLVIGPCYHPDFSDGQALLGDDFRGWQRGWCTSTRMLAFWKEGRPIHRSDPRLDGVALPDGYTEHVISISGPETQRPIWIHKDRDRKGARKEPDCDPRMSEDELKKRGVPIQRFRLI